MFILAVCFVIPLVPCPRLDDPAHGSVSGWRSRQNTVVTYTCMDRYEATEGDMTRTCLKTGVWTGTEPVCTRK